MPYRLLARFTPDGGKPSLTGSPAPRRRGLGWQAATGQTRNGTVNVQSKTAEVNVVERGRERAKFRRDENGLRRCVPDHPRVDSRRGVRYRGASRPRPPRGLEAQVAQLVEQRTENPRVSGSIPSLGTIPPPAPFWVLHARPPHGCGLWVLGHALPSERTIENSEFRMQKRRPALF